jgi:hypothetical protein
MKNMGVWWYTATFLDLSIAALDGSEWSASCPGTQWIGCWVDLRVSLDAVDRTKILHYQESDLGCPAFSLSLYQ